MRAVRCHELTGPEALSVDEIPEPKPGLGEVLVDVRAAGVNFPDILITQGKYQFKPDPPFIPGGEVAGVVSALGEGVSGVQVGERVAGSMLYGAFAERVVVPEAAIAKLPDNVGFDVGASFILTYATTLYALQDRARLKAGETLLVLGAAGGVGIAAVELGKALGARVIAAASSDEKIEFCKAHGADAGINYASEDLKQRAKELSGGGVDVVYDPVGGAFTEQAVRSLAWDGRLLVVGFASGEIPKLPLNLVLLKSCQLVGVFWGAFAMREPAKNRDNISQLLAWFSDGTLQSNIDARVPFADAKDALLKIARREVRGKVILVP